MIGSGSGIREIVADNLRAGRHGFSRPQQYEFARLNLDYTILSKRRLLALVKEGHVDGWDDQRMSTIAAIRRRGVGLRAVQAFADLVGRRQGQLDGRHRQAGFLHAGGPQLDRSPNARGPSPARGHDHIVARRQHRAAEFGRGQRGRGARHSNDFEAPSGQAPVEWKVEGEHPRRRQGTSNQRGWPAQTKRGAFGLGSPRFALVFEVSERGPRPRCVLAGGRRRGRGRCAPAEGRMAGR